MAATTATLGACGGGDEDDASRGAGNLIGGSGDLFDPSPSFASSWTPAESDCEDWQFPLPLTVSTTTDSERGYLDNVVACAGDQQYGPVWLHNVGDEVWVLQTGTARLEWPYYTSASGFFAQTFDGSAVLNPEDVLVVHAPPRQVAWTLDKALTMAWETQSEGLEHLEAYGQEALEAALRKKGSPAAAALVACTTTAYDVADQWSGEPDQFVDQLEVGLTTGAGAASCASQWETAWSKKFKPTAQFLEQADTRFSSLSSFQRILKIVLS